MKIKVCGMTTLAQLKALEKLDVDFAGLIFYEKSKRFVGGKLEDVAKEVRKLTIEKVGVFVNLDKETINARVEEYGLSYVQLHGDETPEFCNEMKELASVIKVIRISPATVINEELKKYGDCCDYFLFDTDSKQYGGTGKQFDWNVLHLANISKPFFLSGGIGLEDVDSVKSFQHPLLFAIDINSRFESEPGIKDLNKVKGFIDALK